MSRLELLVVAIQHTKKLWEEYKTLEISEYLEYLKELYEAELSKQCQIDLLQL